MKFWEVVNNVKTDEGDSVVVKLIDSEYRNAEVSFKWDGCIDYRMYSNGVTVDDEYSAEVAKNTDYFHICDINDMIQRLQEIKEIAERELSEFHFKEYWHDSN